MTDSSDDTDKTKPSLTQLQEEQRLATAAGIPYPILRELVARGSLKVIEPKRNDQDNVKMWRILQF